VITGGHLPIWVHSLSLVLALVSEYKHFRPIEGLSVTVNTSADASASEYEKNRDSWYFFRNPLLHLPSARRCLSQDNAAEVGRLRGWRGKREAQRAARSAARVSAYCNYNQPPVKLGSLSVIVFFNQHKKLQKAQLKTPSGIS
jgi:hypothetical protein